MKRAPLDEAAAAAPPRSWTLAATVEQRFVLHINSAQPFWCMIEDVARPLAALTVLLELMRFAPCGVRMCARPAPDRRAAAPQPIP